MTWGTEDSAEWAVDLAAAAILAAAAGFALWAIASSAGVATAAAAVAFLAAYGGLRQVTSQEPAFPLPEFPIATIEPAPEAGDDAAGELILEDELGEVGPHARVVRLFGPSQNHHSSHQVSPRLPDASEALIEALAELRRSLH